MKTLTIGKLAAIILSVVFSVTAVAIAVPAIVVSVRESAALGGKQRSPDRRRRSCGRAVNGGSGRNNKEVGNKKARKHIFRIPDCDRCGL